MIYNKLVRDKIPDIIKKHGDSCLTHIADDQEYEQSLKAKLQEEVKEFLEDISQEEMADILEVLYAFADLKKFDKQTVEKLRQDKATKRGAFKKRIILEETN
jgi:predicted house-cleaning noncanonical NTP pyrophosphatase (MazG superfamily)